MNNIPFKGAVERLKNNIRDIPDFPKPGIVFKDITPILSNGQLFRLAVTLFTERYQRRSIEKIVAIDARGFLFAGAIANVLGIGMVPVRKKGKLPFKTHTISYDLEYGSSTLEIHTDALRPGERVLVLDDVLATGGTAAAAIALSKQCGAEVVEAAFLVELSALNGRSKLTGTNIFSGIVY